MSSGAPSFAASISLASANLIVPQRVGFLWIEPACLPQSLTSSLDALSRTGARIRFQPSKKLPRDGEGSAPLLSGHKPYTPNVLTLEQVLDDIARALVVLDGSGRSFRTFQPGVGPYGEPQLVRFVAECLKQVEAYGTVQTKRTPDLLISGQWALEFKLVRPFGDNGKEAENWSVNLLHPYEGNVSLIGDCIKLARIQGPEHKAVIVIGYEHTPPRISLAPLLDSFEIIARKIAQMNLGKRVQITRSGLCHPVHQQLIVAGWEVLGRIESPAPSGANGNSPARS